MRDLLIKLIYPLAFFFVIFILFPPNNALAADACTIIAQNMTAKITDACTENRLNTSVSCNSVVQNGVTTGERCCTTILNPNSDYCRTETTDMHYVCSCNNGTACCTSEPVPASTTVYCCNYAPTPVPPTPSP